LPFQRKLAEDPFSTCTPKPLSEKRIAEKYEQAFGQRFVICLGDEKARLSVGDDFRNSARMKCNNRLGYGMGFQAHHAQSFFLARPPFN